MTDKEKKEKFLKAYVSNHGILSEALNVSGVSAKDYNKFMDAPQFAEEVKAVEQIQDDLVLNKFLELVKMGDTRAIIEARKMQKERTNGLDIQDIKTKAMIYFIETCESKSGALSLFCDWFNVAESTAESFYKKVMIENKLMSPHQRNKKKELDRAKRLDVMIENGELDEMGVMEVMLIKSAGIIEDAIHPSEKTRAMQIITDITKKVSEMKAERLRQSALSTEDLCYILDSELMGISIEEVKELEAKVNGRLLEVSDVI
jgi:hypothetical protein